MARYGRPAQKQDGSLRFTGMHRVGKVCPASGLNMRVRGYDPAKDSFDAAVGIAVELFDPLTDALAASWSLERMANSCNFKHASAMYVPAEGRVLSSGLAEYRYGNEVLVGEGTDVFRLLRAIHAGLVWYDPADSVYGQKASARLPGQDEMARRGGRISACRCPKRIFHRRHDSSLQRTHHWLRDRSLLTASSVCSKLVSTACRSISSAIFSCPVRRRTIAITGLQFAAITNRCTLLGLVRPFSHARAVRSLTPVHAMIVLAARRLPPSSSRSANPMNSES